MANKADKYNYLSPEGGLTKESQVSGTQSRYIDSSGKEFSAQDIVSGYRPKKPYKLYSLSDRVRSKSFGRTKK